MEPPCFKSRTVGTGHMVSSMSALYVVSLSKLNIILDIFEDFYFPGCDTVSVANIFTDMPGCVAVPVTNIFTDMPEELSLLIFVVVQEW